AATSLSKPTTNTTTRSATFCTSFTRTTPRFSGTETHSTASRPLRNSTCRCRQQVRTR
ncbi:hypothetical protein HDU98_004509, partial [Podochytrium sp. JEL0797]